MPPRNSVKKKATDSDEYSDTDDEVCAEDDDGPRFVETSLVGHVVKGACFPHLGEFTYSRDLTNALTKLAKTLGRQITTRTTPSISVISPQHRDGQDDLEVNFDIIANRLDLDPGVLRGSVSILAIKYRLSQGGAVKTHSIFVGEIEAIKNGTVDGEDYFNSLIAGMQRTPSHMPKFCDGFELTVFVDGYGQPVAGPAPKHIKQALSSMSHEVGVTMGSRYILKTASIVSCVTEPSIICQNTNPREQ